MTIIYSSLCGENQSLCVARAAWEIVVSAHKKLRMAREQTGFRLHDVLLFSRVIILVPQPNNFEDET